MQARATRGEKFKSFPLVCAGACLQGRGKAGLCSGNSRQARCSPDTGLRVRKISAHQGTRSIFWPSLLLFLFRCTCAYRPNVWTTSVLCSVHHPAVPQVDWSPGLGMGKAGDAEVLF